MLLCEVCNKLDLENLVNAKDSFEIAQDVPLHGSFEALVEAATTCPLYGMLSRSFVLHFERWEAKYHGTFSNSHGL